MRYTRLILDGFKPLRLSGTRRIEWMPEAAYQIILGTNGCGKSSLMAELHPLPPSPSDFEKGGLKQLELYHEGHSYVVTSEMGSTPKHSFLRDEEELNVGGTAKVQIELCERFFRYNKDRHAFLIGKKGLGFTRMNQSDRRQLITKMSRADYRYALSLYDSFARSARDMEGALKRVKRRLHDETLNLSQMKAEENVEELVRSLQEDLKAFYLHRDNNALHLDKAEEYVRSSLNALEAQGRSLIQIAEQISPTERERGVEVLGGLLGALQQELTVNQTLMERFHHEYADTEALLASFGPTSVEDVSVLEERLAIAKTELRLVPPLQMFPELKEEPEPALLKQITQSILGDVMNAFAQLPDNTDRKFNREKIQASQQALQEATTRIDQLDRQIKAIDTRLHHIEHSQQETCPACDHRFVPGVKPGEKENLHHERQALSQQRESFHTSLAKHSEYLTEAQLYMDAYRRYRGFVNQYPRLEVLWRYIQSNNFDVSNPGEHSDMFHQWMEDVDHAIQGLNLSKEINELERSIELAKQGNAAQLKSKLESIAKSIETTTAAIARIKGDIGRIQTQKALYERLAIQEERWNQTWVDFDARCEEAIHALVNGQLEKAINQTQSQLGALQHSLNAKQVLVNIIKDLEKELDTVSLEHAALSLLAKELSPKEGLIAEMLMGFITCLVSQINAINASIWSYELEVLPCNIDNGNLDYQFPMRCGTNGPEPEDVSDGSQSQRDVVDFAFRLVNMLYEGLEDYPLFIDELGASFDEAHRPAINQFIARLMESGRYSQVFFISHYEAGWGAFGNAEYLVLDSRNIAVPEPHNTHAILS